jgi:hypothetical protein
VPLIDADSRATYFSINEVAARWGVSASTVRDLHIRKQALQVKQIAGRLLVPAPALLTYEILRMRELRGRIKLLQRSLKRLEGLPEHKGEASQPEARA